MLRTVRLSKPWRVDRDRVREDDLVDRGGPEALPGRPAEHPVGGRDPHALRALGPDQPWRPR